MTDRDVLLIEAVRQVSGGEWIEAAAVARYLRRDVLGRSAVAVSPATVARALPALARAGHFDIDERDGSKCYRAQVSAVVVYDDGGQEAGRVLLWRTAGGGFELDCRRAVDALKAQGFRLALDERAVRTVRAACDDALWQGGR